MNIAIKNATIIPMNQKGQIIRNGTVLIEDTRIIEMGKDNEVSIPQGAEILAAEGKLLIPSFLNAHTHTAMTLLRGYADDMDVQTWLTEKIWPIEGKFTTDHFYTGAKLAAVESVLSGCTLMNSMYFQEKTEAKAITEVGIRANSGPVMFSWTKGDDKNKIQNAVNDLHLKEDGRIRVVVSPHAPYTVDPDYFFELRVIIDEINEKLAPENQIIFHIHTAETYDEINKIKDAIEQWKKEGKVSKSISLDKGIMNYLKEIGFLLPSNGGESNVLGVHGVSLTPQDLEIMAKHNVKVAHCPASNLKLGSGIPPIPDMLEQNIVVGLGTDGAASNNCLDMFDAIRLTALIHKGIKQNATLISAYEAISMATMGSAMALGCQKELGSIEIGKKADLTLINLKKPHLIPLYNEISHLAYCVKYSDVETVLCNGKIVLHNGNLEYIELDKLYDEVETAKASLSQT